MAPVKQSFSSGTPQIVSAVVFVFSLLYQPVGEAAVLRGVVSDFLTGKPVARASVTIEAVGRTQGQIPLPVLTNSNGQFALSQLSPGAYLVSAQKKGFVRSRFGQRQWNSPGTPIVLEQETLFSADLKLHRPGAVMGEVYDENHLGLAGVTVYAWKTGRMLKLVAAAETDDRGFFRIAGLPPGRYLLRTGSKELEDHQGILPTFLGGVTRAAEATPVDVRLDQELTKLIIEPRHGRLTNLSGTVTGGPPGKVILYSDTGKREFLVGPEGQFSIDQLAPGEYDLLAESGSGPELLAAQSRVVLAKENENATLQLSGAPQLQVRCESAAGRLPAMQGVSIFVRRREERAESQSQRISCGENLPLLPGSWEFATSAPPDMYVAEVRNAVAAGDSYDVQINLGQSSEVTVVFASQPGTLSGKVTTSDGEKAIGAPVFLNAVDADLRSRLGGVRMVRSNEKGEYQFSGLAPGRYEVISSFDIQDPGEAQWILGTGRPVTIDQNGKSQLDISVQDIREAA
jgi:Carboxypeptidase regulatory-like domain